MKVTISLGANTFDAEGEFEFNENFQDSLRLWVNAQPPNAEDGKKLDELSERLKDSNAAARSVVAANTPQ